MGLTNIQFSTGILHSAGRQFAIPALFPDYGIMVTLHGSSFEQKELEAFKPFICCNEPHRDQWLRFDKLGDLTPGPADDCVKTPTLRTVGALKEAQTRANEDRFKSKSDLGEDYVELAFILLVRGNSGALATKMRVFYSEATTSAAIYEEAVNGYHVAFSGVMLRSDVDRLSQGQIGVDLVVVESLKALVAAAGESDRKHIPLTC